MHHEAPPSRVLDLAVGDHERAQPHVAVVGEEAGDAGGDGGVVAGADREVALAVDEACTNAIRHAYEGRDDGVLLVTLRSNGAWIEMEVRDAGLPAPPEHLMRKELKAPSVEDLKPHGLGVQLIYRVFDEVAFWPGEEEGNCVTMRLKQPEPRG